MEKKEESATTEVVAVVRKLVMVYVGYRLVKNCFECEQVLEGLKQSSVLTLENALDITLPPSSIPFLFSPYRETGFMCQALQAILQCSLGSLCFSKGLLGMLKHGQRLALHARSPTQK